MRPGLHCRTCGGPTSVKKTIARMFMSGGRLIGVIWRRRQCDACGAKKSSHEKYLDE
jgi:hypothetical protein